MTRRRKHLAAEAVDLGACPARVLIEQRADPDAPNRTIRGGRTRCQYDTLHARGGLTDAEREAADRYAVLCEMEAGARDRPAVPIGRRPPWQQGHPTMTQVQAAAQLRAVHGVVGNDGAALLRLYVRDNLPAVEIAKRRKEADAVTLGRIRAALGRAAEQWGME